MRRYFRTKIWIIIGRNIVILEMFAATFDVQISAPVENKFMVSFHVHFIPRSGSKCTRIYIYIYTSCRARNDLLLQSNVTELRHEKRVINFLFTKDRLRK